MRHTASKANSASHVIHKNTHVGSFSAQIEDRVMLQNDFFLSPNALAPDGEETIASCRPVDRKGRSNQKAVPDVKTGYTSLIGKYRQIQTRVSKCYIDNNVNRVPKRNLQEQLQMSRMVSLA
jgi:hypothetical protein